jgi:putative oxidoreductase
MKKIFSIYSLSPDVVSLLLRLLLGGMFVRYGYTKLASYHEILPMFGDVIGIGATLSFQLVIFAELVCGFLVLIGFITRLSAVPILVTMLVAFFVAHKADPFDMKAITLAYAGLALIMVVQGAGKFSIDALLFRQQRHRPSNN